MEESSMFFLLPALAVIAETAATVSGTVLAAAGSVGATIAAGTATAATVGAIAAGTTTTALNVTVIEVGKGVVSEVMQ